MTQHRKSGQRVQSPPPAGSDQHALSSLQGHLLVASPHIGDERFDKTVILMCHHDPDSAMGLVINKTASRLNLGDLYEKLDIGAARFCAGNPVHIGGPVDGNRGFVLHSQDHMLPESMEVTHEIGLTASIDILRDITEGVGPARSIVSLGCAGWSAGQLDREMAENVWLSIPASAELVFDHDRETLWEHSFGALGIDPGFFAGTTGSA
jgi:putative transcriptional regulator